VQKINELHASYENCNRLGPGQGIVSFFEFLNKYDVNEPIMTEQSTIMNCTPIVRQKSNNGGAFLLSKLQKKENIDFS